MTSILQKKTEINEHIVCCRHDILLMKTNKENEYILTFSLENHNIDLHTLLDWELFDFIYSLNEDILENRSIVNIDDDTKHYIFLFKRFGAELGISQRYLSFNIKKIHNHVDKIRFISQPNTEIQYNHTNIEPITSNFAIFDIVLKSNHKLSVSYHYHIDLHEQLPRNMKNIAGVLIKKLFWRFKTFIENLK